MIDRNRIIQFQKNQDIGLANFKIFCHDNQQDIESYSFLTGNEEQQNLMRVLHNTLSFKHIFNRLVVGSRSISMTNGKPDIFGHYENYITFYKIKAIKLDEYIENLTLTFRILCGDLEDSDEDIEYIIGLHLK